MNFSNMLVSSCVQLLWPAHCAGCDVLLQSDDAVFCGACAHSITPLGLACAGCALLPQFGPGAVHPASGASGAGKVGDGDLNDLAGVGNVRSWRCPGCARRDFAFSRAYAGFEYGAALATAIVRMKHGGRPDLARRLGRLLQDAMVRALGAPAPGHGPAIPPIDAILPVPLHPRKLRRRGFNQALELARVARARIHDRSISRQTWSGDAGKGWELPAIERRLLLRVRHTRELGRSGPGARRIEVFGAFAVADPARIAGRRFLVVDDVMTTGATLNECAETLMQAGATEVRVVALARTL